MIYELLRLHLKEIRLVLFESSFPPSSRSNDTILSESVPLCLLKMPRIMPSWRLLLILLICGSILGFVFLVFGQNVAIMAMSYVVPFLAAIAVALSRPSWAVSSKVTEIPRWFPRPSISLICMAAFFFLIETLSIFVRLTSNERTLTYFALEGLAIFALSVQVLIWRGRGGFATLLMLSQIGVLVALEIALKTLPLPYYTGNSDIISHEQFVRGITESGHIGSFMGDYQFVPVFHVISSLVYSSLNLGRYEDAILILCSIMGYTLPFIFYSILRRTGASGDRSMLYALIVPLSFVMLYSLSLGLPGVLTFLFFSLLLFVSLSATGAGRMSVVGFVTSVVLILSHQVSIPVIIVVMFLTLAIWSRSQGFSIPEMRAKLRPTFILAIGYILYQSMYLMGLYTGILSEMAFTSDVTIPTSYRATLSDHYVLNFLIVNAPFSIWLSLIFYGWLSYSKTGIGHLKNRFRTPLFILGALAIATYIPGPIGHIGFLNDYLALGGRSLLIAEQLVIWFGLFTLCKLNSSMRFRGRIFLACVVSIVLLGSVMSQSNTVDTSATKILGPEGSTDFRTSELASFSFSRDFAASRLLLTDFVSSRYLTSNGVLNSFPLVLTDVGVLFSAGSTVLLRTTELSKDPLGFYSSESTIRFPKFVSIGPTDISQIAGQSDVVYSSGSVDIMILTSELFLKSNAE